MTTTALSTAARALQADATPDAITGMTSAVRQIGGDTVKLEEVHSRRWQSPTFAGTRMELRFGADTEEAAARIAASLGSASISIPGHVVADVTGWADGRTLHVEALTVDDD